MPRAWFTMVAAALLGACGGGGGDPASPVDADVRLLFFGNSHTHQNDVPGLVRQMLEAADPQRSVAVVTGPGSMFLDERLADRASLDLIASQRWSAVVLQAQRYSASGTVDYSTAEAMAWVRLARTAGAVPVMFPEWPRRGVDESARIFDLHVSIASTEPACVPPIPQAFDLAAASDPGLALHTGDGNHSAPAGAMLAAMVITATLNGRPATAIPTLPSSTVDAATQARLREAAAAAVAQTSPWIWCPGDRP